MKKNNGNETVSETGSKGRNGFSAFCSVLGTIVCIALILLCFPVTLPRLFGVNIYNVETPSMEPAIKVGSLLYVIEEEQNEAIISGDVIAFHGETGDVITHRVVSNDTMAKEIVTKGDANEMEDPVPVKYDRVIGTMRLHIPFLGIFYKFFASLQGKIICGAALVASFILMIIGKK